MAAVVRGAAVELRLLTDILVRMRTTFVLRATPNSYSTDGAGS
jgi:hypothetical protein